MLALLVALAVSADPEPCTRVERLEKQLAAIRAPLPPAKNRGAVAEDAERMLRALVTVEPEAIHELLELNMPDHGAMPTRKAGDDIVPVADWKPLRAKLLLK